MSTDIPKSSGNPEKFTNPAGAPPAMDTSSQHGKTEELRERAHEVQERIETGFHEMEQRYDDAREQLSDLNDRAVDFIRQNPAACVAGAVGVGYILGRLASRRWLS
jgi:ElaB/YqjD/DUF883 family membrane-anchored ribosome-binding protein